MLMAPKEAIPRGRHLRVLWDLDLVAEPQMPEGPSKMWLPTLHQTRVAASQSIRLPKRLNQSLPLKTSTRWLRTALRWSAVAAESLYLLISSMIICILTKANVAQEGKRNAMVIWSTFCKSQMIMGHSKSSKETVVQTAQLDLVPLSQQVLPLLILVTTSTLLTKETQQHI